MKQLGITLLVMTALGLIASFFQLRGIFWDGLFFVLILTSYATIPQFKQVLAWKFHWRMAFVVAVICTFVTLWQIVDRLMGDYRQYSLPVTMILLSLVAFLFHFLDNRNAK
jgi:hypothetical protein